MMRVSYGADAHNLFRGGQRELPPPGLALSPHIAASGPFEKPLDRCMIEHDMPTVRPLDLTCFPE